MSALTDLQNIETQPWRAGGSSSDERSKGRDGNVFAADYYETLRLGPGADQDSIERVFRTLAERLQPENRSQAEQREAGGLEAYLRLKEAYETLSDPLRRSKYDSIRNYARAEKRFWLRRREFFEGAKGNQNRRLAVLCLLYRQRIATWESPVLGVPDLEQLTGCTREELASALWYLCEKNYAKMGEFTEYSITAEGFDVVESSAEEQAELGVLATFEGIRCEQRRRLAVLCLLYRQSTSELPGLSSHELERASGCTREELGSALWYLREKKWAKFSETSEYSITVAVFDVVEHQL